MYLKMTSGVQMNNALLRAKILFDLNGYIVIRNVLSPQEISLAKSSVANHAHEFKERKGPILRNSANSPEQRFAGDGSTGRFDLGRILEWGDESKVFKNFICHKNLVPYLNMLLGEGYRLDHSPFVIKQQYGSEGFSLHGGPCRELNYAVVQGEMINTLLGCVVFLNPQSKQDGGYCVVKGSHKMNFAMQKDMMTGADSEFFEENVFPVAANPGDVVLFSESTVHGALAWTNKEQERLLALYRFSPATNANARGYTLDNNAISESDPEPVQVVGQKPFDVRFDRKVLGVVDGEVQIRQVSRTGEKREFDEAVFGKKYF